MSQLGKGQGVAAIRREGVAERGRPPLDEAAMASVIVGVLGVIGGLASVVGLYLGIHSLQRIARSGGELRGERLAVAGIVVSVLSAFVWQLVLAALMYRVFGRALGLPPAHLLVPWV